jgi:predicted TIM-barrel fold metal-dependent hydrolase
MIIDSHVHVWPRGLVHPAQRGAEALLATADQLVSQMRDVGITVAFISPATVYPDNEFSAAIASRWPTMLRTMVGVQPGQSVSARTLEDLKDRGAIGLRMDASSQDASYLSRPREKDNLGAVVSAAAALGLVIDWASALSNPRLIELVASLYPAIDQVLDHLGSPAGPVDPGGLTAIRSLARLPSVHVKLSGLYAVSRQPFPYRDAWPLVEAIISAFGPTRTMWGSDWPLATESASYRQQLELVDYFSFLDASARQSVLGGTASRIFLNGASPKPDTRAGADSPAN